MSAVNKYILNGILKELAKDTPSTIEEAEEFIKKDDEAYKGIILAANINAIIKLLINKGIITEEQYNTWYKVSEQACLRVAAETVLKQFEE